MPGLRTQDTGRFDRRIAGVQACAALGVQARAREVHTLQRAVVVDNWEHQDPERPVEKGCRNGHKDGPAEAPVVPGRHRGIDGRTKGCAGRCSPTPPPLHRHFGPFRTIKKRQKEKESLLDFELKTFISTGGAASFANAQAVKQLLRERAGGERWLLKAGHQT